MFTLEQINEMHDRLGTMETFAQYVRALRSAGVERYDSYLETSKSLAESGVEKWTVDTNRMTMIFYDKAGHELLVEAIEEQ